MIRVEGLTARAFLPGGGKVDLGPLTFALAAGSASALVGGAADGVEAILAVLAGAERPRKGTVSVAELPASPRPSVAYVPHEPDLPAELSVADYVDLARSVRGEPPASARERLALLGVAALAPRRIGGLTLAERRSVALAEALTSRAEVLLLSEPLADLDPRSPAHVALAVRARVDAGAAVVISTASPADARALGAAQLSFKQGKLTERTTADEAWEPAVGTRGARLLIRSEGARFLLAELAADPTFDQVHGEGAELVVRGRDPLAMAAAIATATRHANVELELLTFLPAEGDA